MQNQAKESNLIKDEKNDVDINKNVFLNEDVRFFSYFFTYIIS